MEKDAILSGPVHVKIQGHCNECLVTLVDLIRCILEDMYDYNRYKSAKYEIIRKVYREFIFVAVTWMLVFQTVPPLLYFFFLANDTTTTTAQTAETVGEGNSFYTNMPQTTTTNGQQSGKKPDDEDDHSSDESLNGVGSTLDNAQASRVGGKDGQSETSKSLIDESVWQSEGFHRDPNIAHNPRDEYMSPKPDIYDQISEYPTAARHIETYPYQTLAVATGNFDGKKRKDGGALIAAGSFGEVFYAILEGQGIAAVKRLKGARSQRQSSKQLSKRQFTNEVAALTGCQPHENIATLLGLSSDGPELCLVYQYVGGGTLSEYLSRKPTESLLWRDRLNIAIGVAKALHHIHACSPPIIHRDVKSSNILLLSDLTAVLTDFGLSCRGEFTDEPDASFIESGSTSVGTRCYMPPEAFKGIFSTRSDIYSFGMVLFEILTGLSPYSKQKKTDLITYLRDTENEGIQLTAMTDQRASWPSEVAEELFILGMRCAERDSHERPLASEALRQLQAQIVIDAV